MRRAAAVLGLLTVGGCADTGLDPDGFHWGNTLVGVKDTCNDPAVPSKDDVVYTLVYAGSDVDLEVGLERFASGKASGCLVDYTSSVIRESRGPGEEEYLQWVMTGSATVRQGGAGCDVEGSADEILIEYSRDWASLETGLDKATLDWVGVERFEIVGVGEAITDVPLGCTYDVVVAGKYLGSGA